MLLSRIVLRDLDSIDSPAPMASSKKVVTRDEWERKLRDVKIRKEDMNFLVTEGFVHAADKFCVESGTQPDIDLATITDWMEVKRAVQSGNVQEAIERIDDLNPTESSLFMGLSYAISSVSIFYEYTNDVLDMAPGSCFPRFKYRKNEASSQSGSLSK